MNKTAQERKKFEEDLTQGARDASDWIAEAITRAPKQVLGAALVSVISRFHSIALKDKGEISESDKILLVAATMQKALEGATDAVIKRVLEKIAEKE